MKSRGLGPHSRGHRLALVDRRTQAGKLFAEFRDDLLAHIGPNPSMTVKALVDRCCWVHLRCCLMDAEIASGTLSEIDSKQYLAWANTERRILGQLGLEGTPTPRRTVEDVRAEVAAMAAGAAA